MHYSKSSMDFLPQANPCTEAAHDLWCGRQWTSESTLKTQQLTHMSEKTHACSHCKKKFGMRNQLQQHEVEVHGHATHAILPVVSESQKCSAKFPRKWNLQIDSHGVFFC
ncbi:hypothetical protein DMENIID0001_111810 [Sergentomyia squamirostris]